MVGWSQQASSLAPLQAECGGPLPAALTQGKTTLRKAPDSKSSTLHLTLTCASMGYARPISTWRQPCVGALTRTKAQAHKTALVHADNGGTRTCPFGSSQPAIKGGGLRCQNGAAGLGLRSCKVKRSRRSYGLLTHFFFGTPSYGRFTFRRILLWGTFLVSQEL